MKKNKLISQIFAFVVVLTLLVTALPITDTVAAAGDMQETHLPSIQVPPKGNPKLESAASVDLSPAAIGNNSTLSEYESTNSKLASQLEELYQQKQALAPAQKKIDSDVLQVVQQAQAKASALSQGEKLDLQGLSNDMLRVNDAGDVEVKLSVTSLTPQQIEELKALGMRITITLPEYGIVEGSLPFNSIEAVAALDFVAHVGTPAYPWHNTGSVTSAGDTILQAAAARSTFGVDGSGIKVGVISAGVNHLSASVASGDLPSSPAVQVIQDLSGDGDEGTAMLEIVHDLAPGAQLAFYDPTTSSDMVNGIRALKAAGCKVIVDDLTFPDQPKFEDGPIAIEARQFCTDGGVYVSSAGNFGGNSTSQHYEGYYNRTVWGATWEGKSYPYAHNYASGSTPNLGNGFLIPNGGKVRVQFEWNNRYGQSADDFDLYLVEPNSNILKYSITPQVGSGSNPYEALYYQNTTGSTVTAFLVIVEHNLVSPPSSLLLACYVRQDYPHDGYYYPLQYINAEDSVWGQEAVSEVLSVAAADAATPGTIEPFSSCGKAKIYFPTYEERQVPNITGVDEVQTKTGQLGYFDSNPFGGTSAAAPHVAAIAALVWSANPTLTSTQVFNAITSSAVDLLTPGWDTSSGFGRVDAYSAVSSVLTTPSVTTDPAGDIASGSATLNGNLTAMGTATSVTVSFEWGNTTLYGNETPAQSMTGPGAFSGNITGLNPNTIYHFRAKAIGDGTSYGNDTTFTTNTVPPTVITNPAGNLTTNSAVLNGNLTDMGTATSVTVSFEWGNTTSYGNETPAQSMTGPGAFSGNITGLNPNTIYHFRAKAIGNGTSYGNDTTIRHWDLPLNQGWNLVSFPLITDNSNIGVVLAGIENNIVAVWSYDANSTASPWSSWRPGLGGALAEISDGKGYWINMRVPDTLTIWGNTTPLPHENRQIPLNQGWNLMSLPLITDNSNIGVVLAGIENNIVAVWSYDANSTASPWSSWRPGLGGALAEMTDGKGYWINMRVPDTLTVSGSPSI